MPYSLIFLDSFIPVFDLRLQVFNFLDRTYLDLNKSKQCFTTLNQKQPLNEWQVPSSSTSCSSKLRTNLETMDDHLMQNPGFYMKAMKPKSTLAEPEPDFHHITSETEESEIESKESTEETSTNDGDETSHYSPPAAKKKASSLQPGSISDLIKNDRLLAKATNDRNRRERELLKLQEQLLAIQTQLPIVKRSLINSEEVLTACRVKISTIFKADSVSSKFFQEYKNFCEALLSLRFCGDRTGFSIICNAAHDGDYIRYDAEFEIFKSLVETPYQDRNFRCVASIVKTGGKEEHIVEFWPISYPKPMYSALCQTWGELFVSILTIHISLL